MPNRIGVYYRRRITRAEPPPTGNGRWSLRLGSSSARWPCSCSRGTRLENRSCSRFWPAWDSDSWWRRSCRFDRHANAADGDPVGITAALTLCYRHQMRWLLLIRVLLLLTMLGLAVAWLTGTTDDVSGPLLLVCPLVIFTIALSAAG